MTRSFFSSPIFIAIGTVIFVIPVGIVILFTLESGLLALLAMVGCFAALMSVKIKEDKKYEMTQKIDSYGQTMIFGEFCTEEQMTKCIHLGADVNAHDCKGQTALHVHSALGHDWADNLLLLNGADVDARDSIEQTPLFLAKNLKTATCLVDHHADVNARDKNQVSVLTFIRNKSLDQNISDSDREELLSVIDYLESQGAKA